MTMSITIFTVALLACVICFVEWTAARTNGQRSLFKTLTLTTAVPTLASGVAAGASGQVATLGWCTVGCVVVFVGYGIYRAVTRKG